MCIRDRADPVRNAKKNSVVLRRTQSLVTGIENPQIEDLVDVLDPLFINVLPISVRVIFFKH